MYKKRKDFYWRTCIELTLFVLAFIVSWYFFLKGTKSLENLIGFCVSMMTIGSYGGIVFYRYKNLEMQEFFEHLRIFKDHPRLEERAPQIMEYAVKHAEDFKNITHVITQHEGDTHIGKFLDFFEFNQAFIKKIQLVKDNMVQVSQIADFLNEIEYVRYKEEYKKVLKFSQREDLIDFLEGKTRVIK